MKASICIITYNHEQWIADAVESALMQVADFDFEIVIGEDCSTDGTANIAQQYQSKWPGKIRVVSSNNNIGCLGNVTRAVSESKGNYIAIMAGDDLWTCPHKLKDQIDFLEANPDYAASVTQAAIEYNGCLDKRFESNYARTQESWEGSDVINTPSFAAASSIVFKKEDLLPLPAWFEQCAYGDSAIRGILAAKGKFHYLQRKCVTYRCNNWGMLQTLREKGKRHMAKSAKDIQDHIQAYHKEFITA